MTESLESERVRRHVLLYGWNSVCFQLVNPGITHWWSPDGTRLVGWVRAGRLAVAAGAPVCPPGQLAKALAEWQAFAASQGLTPSFFGVEAQLRGVLEAEGSYAQAVVGCQPEWSPSSMAESFRKASSLRAQVQRAANKGLALSEWPSSRAEGHPELARVLEEWLAGRGMPPMGFLVEPHTLSSLEGRRVFVAERHGRVEAFLILSPIPARQGWLTEQFVRSSSAPNGSIEALLDLGARTVAGEGSRYLTMGIVPLLAGPGEAGDESPRWLKPARAWARRHSVSFYNFRGLYEFKAKFRPDGWSPVVASVKAPRFTAFHLRDMARAFTGAPPEAALLESLGRGVRRRRRRP